MNDSDKALGNGACDLGRGCVYFGHGSVAANGTSCQRSRRTTQPCPNGTQKTKKISASNQKSWIPITQATTGTSSFAENEAEN
jgi:hypothetical protein